MTTPSKPPLTDGAFKMSWIIENFTYCELPNGKCIDSPQFVATTLNETKWMLRLFPNSGEKCGYISCKLYRIDFDSPEIDVDCSISIMGVNELPLVSVKKRKTFIRSKLREKNRPETDYSSGILRLACWGHALREKQYFPNETLTLMCVIKSNDSVPVVVGCSVRSRICLCRTSFVWSIKDFSSLQLNQRVDADLPFSGIDMTKFQIFLALSGNTIDKSHVTLKICRNQLAGNDNVNARVKFCRNPELILAYRIYWQDSKGNSNNNLEGMHLFKTNGPETFVLPEYVKRCDLYVKKDLFLHEDIFLLCCEFSLTDGLVHHLPTESETSYPLLKKFYSNTRSDRTLLSNIHSLYKQGKHCDIVIKVGSKTFPAHKLILCSRSEVFNRMLEWDMSEKSTNEINIVDFEPEIIEKMLHFMYTDEIDTDLDYSQVVQLYSVADKYQIQVLLERCTGILIASISVSKVWDILRLGITFNDDVLKKAGKTFICNFPSAVFECEAWEDVVGRLPLAECVAPIKESAEMLRNNLCSSVLTKEADPQSNNSPKKRRISSE